MNVKNVRANPPSGVTETSAIVVKTGNGVTRVSIDVAAAIAQADKKALRFDIGTVGFVVFALNRFDKKDQYGPVIVAKEPGYVSLRRESGQSSIDAKYGSIIREGTERMEVERDGKKLVLEVTATNVPPEEEAPKAVPAPQPYKAAYERYFKNGTFDFEPGFKSGKLVVADKKELEAFPDVAKVFKYLRAPGSSITEQIKKGRILIFQETQTKSYAVAHYSDGESDHRVYLFDKNGKRVGTWDVDDSGAKQFFLARAK